MEISKSGLNLIKSYEGLRLNAYKAVSTEKYYTIGYGHYGADVRKGSIISQVKADELLKSDVSRFERAVNNSVNVDLTQNQFDALVSFTYNVGEGALKSSTLLEKLNKKDYKGAAAEFPRWNKSGGKVLAGLTKRREKERDLFETGISATSKTETKKSTSTTSVTSYKIKSGDTLSGIAKNNNTSVSNLIKLNPSIKNDDVIKAGDTIKVPKKTTSTNKTTYENYKIKSGDTLSGIAKDRKTTVSKLQSINSITNKHVIKAGQTIKVPKK